MCAHQWDKRRAEQHEREAKFKAHRKGVAQEIEVLQQERRQRNEEYAAIRQSRDDVVNANPSPRVIERAERRWVSCHP